MRKGYARTYMLASLLLEPEVFVDMSTVQLEVKDQGSMIRGLIRQRTVEDRSVTSHQGGDETRACLDRPWSSRDMVDI